MKPRILILSFSEIQSDPRVMRQVRLLESRSTLTVAGHGAAPQSSCEFVSVPRKISKFTTKLSSAITLLLSQFERHYWKQFEVRAAQDLLGGLTFDLIIANDIAALPIALLLAKGKPVMADCHEYSPREFEDKLLWRLVFGRYQNYLCRVYLPLASDVSTVCWGIANAYRENFKISPIVVVNAPPYQRLNPSPIKSGKIRMVHHGAALRSRRLEVLIDLMTHLDSRFELDLMLMESDFSYMRHMIERAANNPRIRFVPPVRMEDICSRINSYDLGVYILPPTNFNHEYSLPNKLFEYIQARLAVAVGPSPEMSRIVRRYELGVVSSSFNPSDLATELMKITDEKLMTFKEAAHAASKELSYESSAKILLNRVGGSLGIAGLDFS